MTSDQELENIGIPPNLLPIKSKKATYHQLSTLYDLIPEGINKENGMHYFIGHDGILNNDKISLAELIEVCSDHTMNQDKFTALFKPESINIVNNSEVNLQQLATIYDENHAKFKTFTTKQFFNLLDNNTYQQLSDLYDSGEKKFKALTSTASTRLIESDICSLDTLSTLYDHDNKKFKALTSSPATIFLELDICSFNELSTLYDDSDKFKTFTSFTPKRLLKSNICSFEELSTLYDNNNEKFHALVSHTPATFLESNICSLDTLSTLYDDSDKFNALISYTSAQLLQSNICSFEELSALYDKNSQKCNALLSDTSVQLLQSNICSFEELSALYDKNNQKCKTLLSDTSVRFLKSNIRSFEELSTLYDNNNDKFHALISNKSAKLLEPNICSFEELSALYDKNSEKYNALTSVSSVKLIESKTFAFNTLSQLYDDDLSKFQLLLLDNVRELVHCGFTHYQDLLKQDTTTTLDQVEKHSLSRAQDILSHIQTLNITMGIEVEACSRQDIIPAPTGWKAVSDGSLSVDDKAAGETAIEYVSPILRTTQDLATVLELYDKKNLYSNTSCGLHIHIGIADHKLENGEMLDNIELTKQILLNYMSLEQNGLAFTDRKYKIRRLTLEDEQANDNRIDDIIKANSLEDIMLAIDPHNEGRSCAPVNLESLFKHGTIEFRAHPGTVNSRDILAWVNTINDLVGLSQDMIKDGNKAHIPKNDELETTKKIVLDLKGNDSCIIDHHVANDIPKTITHPQKSLPLGMVNQDKHTNSRYPGA